MTPEERREVEEALKGARRRVDYLDRLAEVAPGRWRSRLADDTGTRSLERGIDRALAADDAEAAHTAIERWERAARRVLAPDNRLAVPGVKAAPRNEGS